MCRKKNKLLLLQQENQHLLSHSSTCSLFIKSQIEVKIKACVEISVYLVVYLTCMLTWSKLMLNYQRAQTVVCNNIKQQQGTHRHIFGSNESSIGQLVVWLVHKYCP